MFAVLNINNIQPNAGRELALSMQAFFMSANIVSIFLKGYRHLDTPVWSVNAPTAFGCECVKRRDRSGCFFYFTSWYKITTFSTVQRLAPTRRSLTKRACLTHLLIPTPIFWVWVSTCRTTPSVICASLVRTAWPSRAHSASAVSCTQPELLTCQAYWLMCWNATMQRWLISSEAKNARRSVTRWLSLNGIRMRWCSRLICYKGIIT